MKIIIQLVFIVTCLVLGFYLGTIHQNEMTAYFDVSHVYSEFTMTKEFDQKLDSIKNIRQYMLDSIRLKVNELKEEYDAEKNETLLIPLRELLTQYQMKSEFFSEDNLRNEKMFKEQIVNQLNSYVKDFGDQKNFNLILGATNQGSVMYADKKLDLTEDIVSFINMRYNDENEDLNP